MERLIKTGGPITKLLEQYRMHPDIMNTLSYNFYMDQLLNLPSVNDPLENQSTNQLRLSDRAPKQTWERSRKITAHVLRYRIGTSGSIGFWFGTRFTQMVLLNNVFRHSYFIHTPCREIFRSRKI